ncbi:MAG: ABC transporter permease [Acidobacteria bacterium]|nr:ABC transporter permease [Acidobacteriota bacterium]
MIWDNLRYALRSLKNNPGFALAAILALGIGIGLNAAMFSVVDGILLKPLPFAEPERLLQVRERILKRTTDPIPLAAGNFYDYRANSKTTSLIGYRGSPFSLILPNSDPERYVGIQVSENFFPFLGIRIVRGRDFTAEDYRPGQDHGVILSHGLWTERFAADPAVIGRQINLNGRQRVVIGIAEQGFEYPAKNKIWAPLVLEGFDLTRRDFHNLIGLARMKPGVTIEQARTEYSALLSGMVQRFPQENEGAQVALTSLLEDFTGPVRPALLALLGAVGFVLAIACANVANLLLARGAARQQELSIRLSLGASRGHLIGQLLTESFVLAFAGGALGIALAYAAFLAFKQFAPQNLPRVDQVTLDGRVILFTLAAVLVTGLLFGLLPAIRLSKPESRGFSRTSSFGKGLVVVQVAAALVLMTGAGLLIRSLYNLSVVDLGFEPSHVITMRVTPLPSKYATAPEKQILFGRDIVERLKRLPGIESAALSTDLPLQGNARYIMRIEGRPPVTVATAPLADFFTVTPGFFEAMRVPLRRGNTLPDAAAPPHVVVNEEFVKVHFPNEDPIGKRLEIGFSTPPNWRTIVGVAANVKNMGVDKPSRVQVYGAYFQAPGLIPGIAPSFSVIARTKGEPSEMAQSIRREVLSADNSQPVWNIQTMTETVNASLSKERFTLFLMAVFAGVAFLLALIGLTGVMIYTVSQRTREIGIRMAIGARPVDVVMMIERRGLMLVVAGLVIGTAVSLVLAEFIASLLFSTSAYDPLVFAGMSAVFLLTALISGWIPARRAAMIDPAITLRAD